MGEKDDILNSRISWSFALVAILIAVFSNVEKLTYLHAVWITVALLLFNVTVSLAYKFRGKIYKKVTENITIQNFFPTNLSLGHFYERLYSCLVMLLVVLAIAFHAVDMSANDQFKNLYYTIVASGFMLSGYALFKLGSLKFNILKKKISIDNLDADFITRSCKYTIDILDDEAKETSILTEYEYISLKDQGFQKLESSIMSFDGNITIKDTNNCSIHKDGDGTFYLRSLKDRLKEGEVIKYTYSAIGENIFPNNNEEYWKLNLKHFTQDCTLIIKMPPGRKIKGKRCSDCSDSDSGQGRSALPTPIVFKENGRDVLIFKVENFSDKDCFKVTWKW